jgi:hypothetical protein
MKNNYFARFAVLTIVLFLASSVFAAGTYSGGDGLSPETAYQIADANDMQEIGINPEDWDKCFILTANIDLSAYKGASFNIIGNDTIRFLGTFDGDCHTIDNFTYISTDIDCIGLFGQIGFGGAVKNLGLTNAIVDVGTGFLAGPLVGLNIGCVVNCYSTTGSTEGQRYVGGLVGANEGLVIDSYSTGSAYGDWYVGGIAGSNEGNGIIANCYSACFVDGTYSIGGLVGLNGGNSIITSCYSTGSVGGIVIIDGTRAFGGLVGSNGDNAAVANSYSIGFVLGDRYVGGIVGFNIGSVKNCYFLDPSAPSNDCGTALSNAAMKQQASFAGWDFDTDDGDTDDFWINEGSDYPKLCWQSLADINGDGNVNLSDFAVLSSAWGTSPGHANYNSACNLSGDTTIDIADLMSLAENW